MNNTSQLLEQFLKEIDFDKRVSSPKGISNDELRQIILDRLAAYRRGEVDTDFILDLASTLYEESIVQLEEDQELIGVLCDLATLQTETSRAIELAGKKLSR